jgi:hypothetical protein
MIETDGKGKRQIENDRYILRHIYRERRR